MRRVSYDCLIVVLYKKKLKTGRNPQYVENLYVGKKNTDSAINEARENQVIYFKNLN